MHSEILLDAGPADSSNADSSVFAIKLGASREVPFTPPDGRVVAELIAQDLAFWAVESDGDPPGLMLRYAGVCDAVMDTAARRAVVYPAHGADPRMVSLVVSGGVLAYVLYGEGRLVLHASAVASGGQALAIGGGAGSGKSTLAALLCAGGARLVADDALCCDVLEGRAVCYPGNQSLRLRSAAAGLAAEIQAGDVSESADGRTTVTPRDTVSEPLDLGAILLPAPTRESTELELERLGKMDALIELLQIPRLIAWRVPGPIRQTFELTVPIIEAVPVYRAAVPWGPPFRDGLAAELFAGAQLTALA